MRVNYTKRRTIPRERVVIRLLERPDGKQAFSAELDFEGLRFHAEARVFVEAYRSYACQRFSFGTVGAPTHPPDAILAEFPPGALPLFRMKVVDARGVAGRMVGVLDRLVPQKPGEVKTDRISLLPVEYVDLGEQVWRLDLEDRPILALNRALPQVGELARADAAFLALAYPAILRRVLEETAPRRFRRCCAAREARLDRRRGGRLLRSASCAQPLRASDHGTERAVTTEVRALTAQGIESFRAWLGKLRCGEQEPAPRHLLAHSSFSRGLSATISADMGPLGDRMAAARLLHEVLRPLRDAGEDLRDAGLWAWRSLHWFDEVCPPQARVRLHCCARRGQAPDRGPAAARPHV